MSTLLAALPDTGMGWLNALLNAVLTVINPILILVAVAGIIYAIVVGVKFVKADEKNEREEAKAKLISVIVGIVVTFILIALFYFLAFNIGKDKLIDTGSWGYQQKDPTKGNIYPTLQTYAGVVKSFFIR